MGYAEASRVLSRSACSARAVGPSTKYQMTIQAPSRTVPASSQNLVCEAFERGANGKVSRPSIKVGYVLFYPTLMLGLLTFPFPPRSKASQTKLWLDARAALMRALMVILRF